MLRESTQIAENEVDLSDVVGGLSDATNIPNAEALVNFAEAIVGRENDKIAKARQVLFDELGNDATVDAAATTSAFHGFVRIADAIGIPYTTAAQGKVVPEIREAAGVNNFYRVQEAN